MTVRTGRETVEINHNKRAEHSFRAFVAQAWDVLEPGTTFVPGVHVDAICEHLQAVIEGRIRDLIINVPPGHAKSLLTCVFWPAWAWIKHPELRWLFGAYRADLAIRDSVKCRTLIQSEWYQKRWGDRFKLKSDQNEKKRFENDKTGYRAITSVGTGTGERGDIVLADDPMSVDQAASDLERTSANEWWSQTMFNRVNDLKTGHHIVIQQRVHEEDTTAICLAQGGYEHLFLPMEYEVDRACATGIGWQDPRRKEGELLWPNKIGPAEVQKLKVTLGSYQYAGQYQQRPSPAGGGVFKKWWWRYWKPKFMDLPPVLVRLLDGTMQKIRPINMPDEFDTEMQSWDMAFKDLDTSDYVVGQVWATRGADRYLMDQKRDRLDFPATVKAVEAMSRKWPKTTLKIVEDKANGSAVIAALRHSIPGLVAVNPEGGKIVRAQAVSPQVESGNVYLPHPAIAPWVDGLIDECSAFPNGKYDDQVDAMSQALKRLLGQVTMRRNTPINQPPSGPRSWMG